MKKLFVTMVSLLLFTGVGALAGKSSTGFGGGGASFGKIDFGSAKDGLKEDKEKQKYSKQSDEYDKKARRAKKAGKKALAKAYKKCAEACQAMATAIMRNDSKRKSKAQAAMTKAEANLKKLLTPPKKNK